MKEEVKRWWKMAKDDVSTAKALYKIKKYGYSSFWCQQAAEKALKALLLERGYELIKTHDLVLLSKKLNAPENIVSLCKELTPVYVETRYPDLGEEGFKKFTRKEVEDDIKNTEVIIRWIKKNL